MIWYLFTIPVDSLQGGMTYSVLRQLTQTTEKLAGEIRQTTTHMTPPW